MLFKRLLLSDLITIMLSGALSTYLYWYAYQVSLDQGMIGLVGLGQLLGLLFASLGGGLADRFNKLSLMKAVTLARLVLILALTLLQSQLDLAWLLPVFMLLSTLCGSLLAPTMEALLPHLSQSDQELYQLTAKLASLTQLAGLLAVGLSALYVAYLPLQLVLGVSLALSVLALLPLFGVNLDLPISSSSVWSNMRQGLVYLVKTKHIMALLPIALLMNLAFWSLSLLLPKLTTDYFASIPPAYSLLELAFSLGGVLGGWYFSQKLASYADKHQIFCWGLIGQSLCLLLMGVSLFLAQPYLAYGLVLLAWMAYAFANTLVGIVYFGSLQLAVPESILGSVMGSLLTLFSLVNPLAALLSEPLTKSFSVPVLVLAAGGLMLLLALLTQRLSVLKQAFRL